MTTTNQKAPVFCKPQSYVTVPTPTQAFKKRWLRDDPLSTHVYGWTRRTDGWTRRTDGWTKLAPSDYSKACQRLTPLRKG